MFEKRCSLCGGKLKNHICTECGLDNRKSEKNYRINQSSCDGMPLTHVHEEPPAQKQQRRQAPEQRTASRSRPAPEEYRDRKRTARKQYKKGRVIFVIFMVILITNVALGLRDAVWDLIYNIETKIGGTEEYEPVDPYEYVEAELPAGRNAAEYMLDTGEYIVGVHIPSGNYTAEPEDDFDAVGVDDRENGIYLYEYRGKAGENYLDDLRLYPGAEVTVSADSPVRFSTENGDAEEMRGIENPLSEQAVMKDGKKKQAGKDFAAGVYDVSVSGGYCSVILKIYDAEGEEYDPRHLHFDESSKTYRNLVIPEDACLEFEGEEIELTLTPSEKIESTDYLGYYMN